MSFVENFEPRALWRHFDRILTIPRGSKSEGAMREYVLSVAAANGLEHSQDETGNVVVRKPATGGGATVILQSHLDMVNEKNSDVQHDFEKDALKPRQEGDYLYATGTTLGADNGIGVAAMLALMDAKDVKHGPLELLFTIDEETGLTGASNLDASILTGKQLINLDSEEEYTLTVGCAGGAGDTLTLPLEWTASAGSDVALRITLSGMHGGHSGLDINLQRGNAVKLLARMLNSASAQFQLADIAGGNKHNAIPREAYAVVVAKGDAAPLRSQLEAEFQAVKAEYAVADAGMQLDIKPADAAPKVCTAASTQRALQLIEALPHGVLAMSLDIPGLVETSNNVATVNVVDDALVITTSSRSSVGSALRSVQRRIGAIAALAGASVVTKDGYPGWKPDMSSRLLGVVKEVHEQVQGREAEIVAVHAGLECGIIGEKSPGMDMISFGPQIEHPHSPNERVHIASVGRFYSLLVAVLGRLA